LYVSKRRPTSALDAGVLPNPLGKASGVYELKLFETHGRNIIMDVEAAKMIGAGLAVIALAGVGIGIGNIFSALVTSIARNPAARSEVFGIGILGFALTEAIALFALVVALLLLFAL
jgi:F-type H+-transporting ATPase subunit c